MVKVTAEISFGADVDEDHRGSMSDMNAWTVTLYRSDSDEHYTVPFFTGFGITEDPTAAMVLESLTLDYSGWQQTEGFADWASEYGYDEDSRRAERLYRRVERQCAKFRGFASDLIPGLMDMLDETGEIRGDERGDVTVPTVQEIAAR